MQEVIRYERSMILRLLLRGCVINRRLVNLNQTCLSSVILWVAFSPHPSELEWGLSPSSRQHLVYGYLT